MLSTLGACSQPAELVGLSTIMLGSLVVPEVVTPAFGYASLVLDTNDLFLNSGTTVFADGFESGDTSAWSATQGRWPRFPR